ncbi:MAG: hypothetical protein AAGF96_00495 [Bacteroidota bacterium]
MNTILKKTGYMERKRQAILNLGYDYVKFRSKAKKSVIQIKRIIINNAYHF